MGTNIVKIAVSAGLIGAAVVGAPTASADSRFNGTYTVLPNATHTWTVSSDCETEGCMAHVTSSSGWTTDFQLKGGNWVGRAMGPVHCLTGTHDVPWIYTIGLVSFRGTAITEPNPFCIPVPRPISLMGPGAPAAPPAPQPAPGMPAPGVPLPPAPGVQPYDPNIFVPGFEPGRLFPNLPGTGGMPPMPQW